MLVFLFVCLFLSFYHIILDSMQCNKEVKDVCHHNAECIRNICVCKSGFHGDGVKTCSSKLNNHTDVFDILVCEKTYAVDQR